MTPLDILKAARAKIEKPECWIKGAMRRPIGGNTCYCSLGAVSFSGGDADFRTSQRALDLLSKAVGGGIMMFNDAPERTHAEVLAAFDRAIELASQQ